MKKLLGIVVLGLLWCNTSFAACLEGDCKNGYGTYEFENTGDKYVGEHKNGKSHGQGTYTFADGDTYTGGYKKGKRHGEGVMEVTLSSNSKAKIFGTWKNGEQHGEFTIKYSDGKIEKRKYKNGKRVK